MKTDKENKINYFFCFSFFFHLYVSVRLNIKHTIEEEYVDSENQTTYKSFEKKQTNKGNKLTY
jgi:hypothetical protein